MKTKWVPVAAALGVIISLAGLFADRETSLAEAESSQSAKKAPAEPLFELNDGDRVVLLGGTMIEREQRFGDWEMLMTTQFPEKRITIRNLGWSGDTVWAESRGIFDPPAEGYRRMIEQVKDLKPTVIFLGYGANESFAGKAGLEKFLTQYKKLLRDLKPTGARFVFLGPPAHDATAFSIPNQEQRDADLKLYNEAIRDLADENQTPFIDFYRNANELTPLDSSDNGVHWNGMGYLASAYILGRELGWPMTPNVTINADGSAKPSVHIKLKDLKKTEDGLQFTGTWRSLPLHDFLSRYSLSINGLEPGKYALLIDGKKVCKFNHEEWAEEIVMHWPDANYEQSQKLREAIIEKNRLYFHRWRPQNVTYLFGFRKHEQGQNAKEVNQFDPLIEKQEELIHELKKPRPHKYVLRRVSP